MVLRVASGVAGNVAFAGCVVAACHFSGLITINTDKVEDLVRSVIPDDLLPRGRDLVGRLRVAELRQAELQSDLRRLAGQNEHRTLGGASGLASALFFM